MLFGVWCFVFGVWCLVLSVWCLVFAMCRLLPEALNLLFVFPLFNAPSPPLPLSPCRLRNRCPPLCHFAALFPAPFVSTAPAAYPAPPLLPWPPGVTITRVRTRGKRATTAPVSGLQDGSGEALGLDGDHGGGSTRYRASVELRNVAGSAPASSDGSAGGVTGRGRGDGRRCGRVPTCYPCIRVSV